MRLAQPADLIFLASTLSMGPPAIAITVCASFKVSFPGQDQGTCSQSKTLAHTSSPAAIILNRWFMDHQVVHAAFQVVHREVFP